MFKKDDQCNSRRDESTLYPPHLRPQHLQYQSENTVKTCSFIALLNTREQDITANTKRDNLFQIAILCVGL